MNRIGRGVAIIIGITSLMGFLVSAHAYSIGSTGATTPNAVNLPQLPSGTFNLNWAGFLDTLPVKNFLTSLEMTGNGTANNAIQTGAPSVSAESGQMALQSIDDWTSAHLGFRFSALFGAILGVLSWVLGFAKSVVDWLLSFIR